MVNTGDGSLFMLQVISLSRSGVPFVVRGQRLVAQVSSCMVLGTQIVAAVADSEKSKKRKLSDNKSLFFLFLLCN